MKKNNVVELCYGRNAKIFANLSHQVIINLVVPWHCRTLVQGWIMPPRVTPAVTKQGVPLSPEVLEELPPFHIIMGSSSNSVPAASSASRRLNSNASRSVTLRLSSNSFFVAS